MELLRCRDGAEAMAHLAAVRAAGPPATPDLVLLDLDLYTTPRLPAVELAPPPLAAPPCVELSLGLSGLGNLRLVRALMNL